MAHREANATLARPSASPGHDDASTNQASGRVRDLATELARRRAATGFYRRVWQRFRRDRVALVGLIVTGVIIGFVLLADLIARATGHPYWQGELRNQFVAPFSPGYLLGTDGNGRDVLVRAAYGGRISLTVAGLAAFTALAIGGAVGAVSGYFRGIVDAVLMRLVDVLLCIPTIPLLILVFSVFTPGPYLLALFIALLGWAGTARLVRGEVLSLRGRDYVEAARVLGAPNSRIIFRHIMPNVLPLLLVSLSLALPGLILVEAALSYIGYGVRVPTPSWGNMLESAREYFTRSWPNVFIPGAFIFVTVLAITLVGNGLRDALDPRLNR